MNPLAHLHHLSIEEATFLLEDHDNFSPHPRQRFAKKKPTENKTYANRNAGQRDPESIRDSGHGTPG